jgi:hypothetical protein
VGTHAEGRLGTVPLSALRSAKKSPAENKVASAGELRFLWDFLSQYVFGDFIRRK